jgi:hypothetical protein
MADSTAYCLSADVSVAGSNYYVRILSTIDRELLKPSASVALHKHSNALVDVLPPEADSSISMLQAGSLPHMECCSILILILHIFEVWVISSRNWQSITVLLNIVVYLATLWASKLIFITAPRF